MICGLRLITRASRSMTGARNATYGAVLQRR